MMGLGGSAGYAGLVVCEFSGVKRPRDGIVWLILVILLGTGGVLVSEREVKWIKVLMRGVDVAIFGACVAADGL